MPAAKLLLIAGLATAVNDVIGHPLNPSIDTTTLVEPNEWYDAMSDWQYWLSLGQTMVGSLPHGEARGWVHPFYFLSF